MKKNLNSIVFFGNEKLATGVKSVEPIIRNAVENLGFDIEQIITGKLSELKPHKSQIAVLAAYGKIIPQSILDEFPLGIINIHPSLLPLYRGPTPIEQAMLDGVTKTGVSIMRLTSGMDEGPIYKQKTLHLSGKESKEELVINLQTLGADLLVQVLPAIIDGSIKPRQQPHPDRATYTHLIKKTDGIIDWNKSAEVIEREVRAYARWPRSQTKIADITVSITEVTVINIKGKPGEFFIQDKKLGVYCSEDAVLVEKLLPAGKKEMDSEAFLAGYRNRLEIGE